MGLTTGLGFAKKNHQINFIDIDKKKIEKLNNGNIDFYESGLEFLLNKYTKNINFSDNYDDVTKNELTFICVDTPSNSKTGEINLDYIKKVLLKLSKLNFKKKHLIIIKSTVLPGTTNYLFEKYLKGKKKLILCNNPEFLREGSALNDFLNPDRIIIGSESSYASKILGNLYSNFKSKIFYLSRTESEYSKYFSNIFFANLISFANEFNDSLSINSKVNFNRILNTFLNDRRISQRINNKIYYPDLIKYLIPGPGYGGSCFPKDVTAFNFYQRKNYVSHKMTSSIHQINSNRDKLILNLIKKIDFKKKSVNLLIYGLAFKSESDDLRNSKSISLFKNLQKISKPNYIIKCIDPYIKDEKIIDKYNIIKQSDIYKYETDFFIIMNKYKEFERIKLKELDKRNLFIFDLRNFVSYKFKKAKLIQLGSY